MSIRDQYIPAFEAIKGKYVGVYPGYKIGPNASLEEVIGYTEQHVIEHTTPHFRYDYYKDVLGEAMRNLHFDTTNRSIFCVDMGCGPGLFSWVVQDYMSSSSVKNENIRMIGYDHAENMILLSEKFHQSFVKRRATKYDWCGYSKIDHLKRDLESWDLSGHDIIVTLGHVLIQIKDDERAIREFSEVIRSLYRVKSCIVIAADAFADAQRRRAFRDGWNGFQKALCDAGMNYKFDKFGNWYSYAYALLDRRG